MNNEIQSKTELLLKQWSDLESTISTRIILLSEIGEKWKNLEDEYRKMEMELNHIRDGLINVDQVIRSKSQLIESLDVLHVSLNIVVHFPN